MNRNVATDDTEHVYPLCSVDLHSIQVVSSNTEISNKLISLKQSILDTDSKGFDVYIGLDIK